MTHALIVGGTGMLSNTSLWLVSKGYQVSVIGRDAKRMESLISKSIDSSLMTPVLVDYNDETLLTTKLRETIKCNGPIDLVIAWIHSYAESALEVIANEISNQSDRYWQLFHILGSSKNLSEVKGKFSLPHSTRYRQIQLGFILENDQSRWLTNDEISQGVIDSIKSGKSINIIGTVEPWGKLPI
ncbi:short-chain dehydrogenase [Rummeliibacillus stabekisii]|uniref:short-chain dehydrogenase n=1 Tax=Rummeliibacillus stabekisii TaxID=241244 RepID=UPI00116ACA7D|nr:short-chain dehydrogenase [Rummeliibacillus stabekisii]MBB5169087.1 hypothetical protein [Rummeliibacillus stabekisii]GEL06437.1 short-chain dehydrogenase [Rummeliibacillus stabekisii]